MYKNLQDSSLTAIEEYRKEKAAEELKQKLKKLLLSSAFIIICVFVLFFTRKLVLSYATEENRGYRETITEAQ